MKTEFIPAKYRAYLLPLASVSAKCEVMFELKRETFNTDLTCDWLTDLLDAGIYAYYYSWYDGGAHNGLALDDPFFYHPQHHSHWTLHGEFCLNGAETC